MRILFLTSAHNSLSQRLLIELTERGHEILVRVVATGEAMMDAVSDEAPDMIIAPMLKITIPEEVASRYLCLIVHPGIKGDRGPSSLDWAIATQEKSWGVTILEAAPDFDAGPIWASHEFPLDADPPAKSSLYRGPVTEAALRGVLDALACIEAGAYQSGTWRPETLSDALPHARGRLRPPMKQADRAIDWMRDSAEAIVRKVRAADSAPGVLGSLLGTSCFLFGAHLDDRIKGPPGQILARRDGAICIGAVDGAVWISHLKAKGDPSALEAHCDLARSNLGCELCDMEFCSVAGIKLPATQVLGPLLRGVPEQPLPIDAPDDHRTFREIVYAEEDGVGYLSFDFYNGAMSTTQCRRLLGAFLHARSRPTRVIVLLGGPDFWSNGIHLNAIEASADPAAESWRNINAMDDLILEILNTMSHLVIAGLRGNAGAGGAMLALAADHAYAMSGVVLNPHYRGMGELYGSEYWTYTLPRRVGRTRAIEADPGLPAARSDGGARDGIARRRIRRGRQFVRGRTAGASDAPRARPRFSRDAARETRAPPRRRKHQTARVLSRRGIGANEGQLLRTRPRLSQSPPTLRLQGRPAATTEPRAGFGADRPVAEGARKSRNPTNAGGCRLVRSVPGRQWLCTRSATGKGREPSPD